MTAVPLAFPSSVDVSSMLPVAQAKSLGVILSSSLSHSSHPICQQILPSLPEKYMQNSPISSPTHHHPCLLLSSPLALHSQHNNQRDFGKMEVKLCLHSVQTSPPPWLPISYLRHVKVDYATELWVMGWCVHYPQEKGSQICVFIQATNTELWTTHQDNRH